MAGNSLLSTQPDSIERGHDQTLFYFGAEPGLLGEQAHGTVYGMVTLTAERSRYTRFKVYRGRSGSGFVKVDDRLLTAEEIRHFQGLIKG